MKAIARCRCSSSCSCSLRASEEVRQSDLPQTLATGHARCIWDVQVVHWITPPVHFWTCTSFHRLELSWWP